MFKVRRKNRTGAFEDAATHALELADEQKLVASKIRELEDFITEAPSRAARTELDRLETIPPPDELTASSGYRHPVTGLEPEARLSRGQAAVLRSERLRNMLVFIVASAIFAAFAVWLSGQL